MPIGVKADSAAPSPAGGGKEQRVTKQRKAVSAALDRLDDFVSTQELYRILQNQGVSVSLENAWFSTTFHLQKQHSTVVV